MQRVTTYLRLFLWFNPRQLRQHPWRLAAVILGIALGASSDLIFLLIGSPSGQRRRGIWAGGDKDAERGSLG
jgi:hypothetical protein